MNFNWFICNNCRLSQIIDWMSDRRLILKSARWDGYETWPCFELYKQASKQVQPISDLADISSSAEARSTQSHEDPQSSLDNMLRLGNIWQNVVVLSRCIELNRLTGMNYRIVFGFTTEMLVIHTFVSEHVHMCTQFRLFGQTLLTWRK